MVIQRHRPSDTLNKVTDRQTRFPSESVLPHWKRHKIYVLFVVINQSGHNVPTSGSTLWEVRTGCQSLRRRGDKKWHWCWVISRDVGRVEPSRWDKVEKKPRKQAAWDIHIYCSKESQITGQQTEARRLPIDGAREGVRMCYFDQWQPFGVPNYNRQLRFRCRYDTKSVDWLGLCSANTNSQVPPVTPQALCSTIPRLWVRLPSIYKCSYCSSFCVTIRVFWGLYIHVVSTLTRNFVRPQIYVCRPQTVSNSCTVISNQFVKRILKQRGYELSNVHCVILRSYLCTATETRFQDNTA